MALSKFPLKRWMPPVPFRALKSGFLAFLALAKS